MDVVFVIFGATGDLAKKRIFPALYKLSTQNLLPKKFKIIASARSQYSSEQFREYLKNNLKIDIVADFENFAKSVDYLVADVTENHNLPDIKKSLDEFKKSVGSHVQVIYYLAISPTIFEQALENIGKHKLNLDASRIIIEKPFGHDLKSAQNINRELSKFFGENQIYRIDHYLGKETVQNLFVFRFGNEIFEPIWNSKYIDHVQITAAEFIGVEKRGEFYDKTGALRDITQNHLLQLLALTAMQEPTAFTPQAIDQKKIEIIKSIKRLTETEVKKTTVRAQYEGYRQEEKINPKSQTESYALIKLELDHPKWQGVPFYLRTGKKLTGQVTSVILQLKETGHKVLENFWKKPLPNHITLQIQPTGGIGIRVVAKKPGLATELEPIDMEYCYKVDDHQLEAYERLLVDVTLGDQTLFMSQQLIEEAWKVIDPIEKAWVKNSVPLETYKPGTWGPDASDKLLKTDGREFLAPLLTICKI